MSAGCMEQDHLSIARRIVEMKRRCIVAIDGVDAAGKTTFADHLASLIHSLGSPVLRASIDGFHNPQALRYRRGKSDPLGYFLDSYNYPEFIDHLITPFRMGAETVSIARLDHRSDTQKTIIAQVPKESILLLDGIFLHRDELSSLWDFSVYISISFTEAFRRMSLRDGFDPDPLADSNKRYLQGQEIYLAKCNPSLRASVVLDGEAIPFESLT